MKTILKILSFIGLGLTLFPSFFVFAGHLEDSTYKTLMLVGSILWLLTAPFWIFKKATGTGQR